MKMRSFVLPTRFLQAIAVAIAVGALAFLIWEPRIEGRNAHATFREIYFGDPFLAYAYLSSIPFFVAIYQSIKALGRIGKGEAFSQATVKALGTIKYCALMLIGLVLAGELFLRLGESDDRAGGVFLGAIICLVSAFIAAATAMLERVFRDAVDGKSGDDST
jgi:hypothetical protein